ncbi:MAG: DUF1800 domain-containing protein [bacterium]|nr:DUF1800 domain-containing protein [Candidatus Kapabacteria bacterium]
MNRRDFLTVPAPVANKRSRDRGLAARRGDGSQVPAVHARRSNTGLAPYAGPWTYTQAAHLMRRAMVGPRDSEIRAAVTAGMHNTIELLMAPFTPDLAMISDFAGVDPQVRPPRDQTSPEYALFQQNLQQRRELIARWQIRTIANSPVSIQERMVLMWSNHFTSETQVVNFSEFMYWQNNRIRQHALGNFKDFTRAITKDMAMLIYLDGIKSFKTGQRGNINENYSRELMELFTMGVSDWNNTPNYTETDVAEGARALTGYIMTQSTKGIDYVGLNSAFEPTRWDNGQKTYLGRTGAHNADNIIDIIFEQRADQTAKYVCEKIYRAFVYDVPDRVVIAEMATKFRDSNWQIAPVVDQLLKSEHFYDETNIGALDKSPIDYLVGMVRGLALGAVPDFVVGQTNRFTRDLTNRLSTLGQLVFDPPNVKGWPGGRTWISTSTIAPRQKFALDVIDEKLVGQNRAKIYTFDVAAFAKSFSDFDDAEVLIDDISQYLLNTVPSSAERASLLATMLNGSPVYEWPQVEESQRVDRVKLMLKALFVLAKFQLT